MDRDLVPGDCEWADERLFCHICHSPIDLAICDPDPPIIRRTSILTVIRYHCRACGAGVAELHDVAYSPETILH